MASDGERLHEIVMDYITTKLQTSGAPRPTGDRLRVDMGTAIRNKALTVDSAELAARHEKVHVLDMRTINALIQEAVDDAVAVLNQPGNHLDIEKMREAAEELFAERLKDFQAQKRDMEAYTWKLQSQLEAAQTQLNTEKKRVVDAETFVVSDAGMEELESRMTRLLEQAVKSGGVSGQVGQEMRETIAHLLDTERARVQAKEEAAQSDRIRILEQKIGRLARNLDQTEQERDVAKRHAQALEASGGGGLRNVMTVGLDDGSPGREKKLELLKEIFDQNKEMRASLKERGIVLGGPKGATETSAQEEETPTSEKKKRREKKNKKKRGEKESAVAPTPDSVEEAATSESAPVDEPFFDPDDLPWDPPAKAVESTEESSSVKRIQAKKVKPPPLQGKNNT